MTCRGVSHHDVSIPNIRKKLLLEAVGAFFSLPPAGMLVLGVLECGGDEGLKVEGGFTFGRLQGGLKGASRRLEGGFKGLHLEGGFKGA